MRSLYSRVFLITVAVILASSLLGFIISNVYYHIQLKSFNDQKLVTIAEQIKEYAEDDPERMEDYLHNAAALGYEIYLTNAQGEDRFFGSEFRKQDLSRQAIDQVLNGEVYHGVAQFPNKLFITAFSITD